MDDERIERALRLGPPDEPAYAPRGHWQEAGDVEGHADASAGTPVALTSGEIGAPGTQRVRPIGVRLREARRPGRRSFPMTIAASLTLLIGLLLAAQVVPAGPAATPAPSPDLLSRLLAAGSVEIAVTSSAPQTVKQGGAYIGFDVDVAKAIATQLGLQANVSAVSSDGFASGTWDLALPGHRNQPLDGSPSGPYAHWPVWLAAPSGSAVTDLPSLASARVCVVGGSAGADWLAGAVDGATATAPPGVVSLALASDDACIAAVTDGRADALLTAALFSDEVEARGLQLVVPTPVVSDPRTVVVRGPAADSSSLLAAVNDAIAELRASGRLAELSEASFGGRDVTVPGP